MSNNVTNFGKYDSGGYYVGSMPSECQYCPERGYVYSTVKFDPLRGTLQEIPHFITYKNGLVDMEYNNRPMNEANKLVIYDRLKYH